MHSNDSFLPTYKCERISPSKIKKLGYNLGKSIPYKKFVVIGQNSEVDSNELRDEFIKGINIAGISVIKLGICTVQGLIYSGVNVQAHCCIFIDYVHELKYFGISVLLTHKALSLEELKQLLNFNHPYEDNIAEVRKGLSIPINFSHGYLTYISSSIKKQWRPNIVWDISNLPIPEYCNIIINNISGTHKYAVGIKNVTSAVIKGKADFGIIFDKFGKSLEVIDNLGRRLPFHAITVLLINDLANFYDEKLVAGRKKGISLSDIKMPNYVYDFINSRQNIPRISHTDELQFNLSFTKYHVEFAAHHHHGFLFRTLGYVAYDSLYCAMRLISAIIGTKDKLSTWINNNIPELRTRTISLNIKDKSLNSNKNSPFTELIQRLENSLKNRNIQYIKVDGIKVSLKYGEWIVCLDKSNNLQIVVYGKKTYDIRNLIINIKQCFNHANISLTIPD